MMDLEQVQMTIYHQDKRADKLTREHDKNIKNKQKHMIKEKKNI